MDRRYPERPLVGVGAIIFRDDKVLLVKRGHEPSAGKWSIPGGLVEIGESLQTAVAREVREEVCLDVEVLDLVAALDRIIYDEGGRIEYHYILLDFLCRVKEGEPLAATDAADCLFVSLDELPEYRLTEGTEKVIRGAYSRVGAAGYSIYDARL